MKICLVIPFFDPATEFGGPVSVTALLCRELALRGHQLSVVTNDFSVESGQTNRWVEKDGYRVFYARTRFVHRLVPYWGNHLSAILNELIPDQDIIHVHLGLTHMGYGAIKLSDRCGIASVYSPHGCLCPTRLRDKRFAKKFFIELFEKQTLRLASRIHALTPKEVTDVTQIDSALDSRCIVIPNGVEDLPKDDSQGKTFRSNFSIPSENLLVLFLSRISWVKGLDILVDTAYRLKNSNKNLTFVIGGDLAGDYGTQLTSAITDRKLDASVILAGHLSGENKTAALSAADIFVLPSYSEGMPMSVLEALQFGLPCVVTDRCNVPEVQKYDAGRVVGANSDAFTRALELVVNDRDHLAQMSRNAKLLFNDKFSLASVVSKFEELYFELTDKKERGESHR